MSKWHNRWKLADAAKMTSRRTTRTTSVSASRSSQQQSTRSTNREEDSDFRRLAAQLGLSRELQRIADDDVDDDDDDEHGHHGDNDDDERGRDAAIDAPLTPLRSDYSASESHSSELSLPHSFGNYDALRKPPFDDELQRTTQRNTARNASASMISNSGSSDMMRKFYEAQVEKIRAQLAVVAQAHRQVETMLQDERQIWATKMAEMEATQSGERAAHKAEADALHAQVERLRSRLEMEKMHMTSELIISDAHAEQLARQSEEDLTVRECVQVVVHRKVRQVEGELDKVRKELETLQSLASKYKSYAASASDQVEQVTRVAEAKSLRLQHELDLSEASRMELERQITTLCAQLDVLRDAHAQREAESRSQPVSVDVYAENERLKTELQLAGDRHRVVVEKIEELRCQHEELQQHATLLRADKAFLQDAKRQLEDHELRLLAQNKELHSKLDLLTVAGLQEATALHRAEDEARAKFEQQLAAEVEKLMTLSKREIDMIRSSSQQVYERENRLLKEARDDALKQIDMLQTRLQTVQTSLETKVLESTRSESEHMTALASLRSELKMKHFELSQLGVSLEERSVELRGAKLEVEMLQQKVEVHKEEFARLEFTSTTRIAQLEAALESERRRLEEYERLEVELDDAVVQSGAVGMKHETGAAVDEVAATFGAVPSSAKRRFYQSVQLAQRVVRHQKECMELQRQLDNCVSEKRALAEQVEQLHKQVTHVDQPQAYLIQKLSTKDAEHRKLLAQNEHLQQQLSELRAEYQQVNSAKMALQSQLQQVLARRGELDLLKSTVQALRTKLATVDPTEQLKQPPSPAPLKNPPSPHVLSQMIKPPTPQRERLSSSSHPSPSNHDGDPTTEAESAPPKWYIKLRSS